MRVAALIFAALVLCPAAVAQTLCGARNDHHALLGLLAMAAHAHCPGVREIPTGDLGLLAGSSGVDLRSPICEQHVARAMLRFTAAAGKDPAGWCAQARTLLQDHPLTAPLVQAATEPCGELDRASAIIDTATKRCGFRATPAGRLFTEVGKARAECTAQFADGWERDVVQPRLTIFKGDRARAMRVACEGLIREHHEQMREMGMKVWFER